MCNIKMMAGEWIILCSRRTEEIFQLIIVYCILSIAGKMNHVAELFYKFRLSIRSERHHLILIGGMKKAEVRSYSFIKETEGVWHVHLSYADQLIGITYIIACCSNFSPSI